MLAPTHRRRSTHEAEKELENLKDQIADDQQSKVKDLIQDIRSNIQSEKFDLLSSKTDELKLEMKTMIDSTSPTSNNQTMDDLNDL